MVLFAWKKNKIKFLVADLSAKRKEKEWGCVNGSYFVEDNMLVRIASAWSGSHFIARLGLGRQDDYFVSYAFESNVAYIANYWFQCRNSRTHRRTSSSCLVRKKEKHFIYTGYFYRSIPKTHFFGYIHGM